MASFHDYRGHRDRHIAAMLSCWTEPQVCQLIELLERFTSDFETYRGTLLGAAGHDREGDDRP